MEEKLFDVDEQFDNTRLDVYLTQVSPEFSRVNIQNMIKEEMILVNGKAKKANYKVKAGDVAKMMIAPPEVVDILPEDIPLNIIFEDEDMIVINKPRGMVVHPAPNLYSGTLVNALMYHCKDLSGINGEIRPGIVHRLDKDTSGVMVVAKNDFAHQNLAEQIGKHEAVKEYIALVHGKITEDKGSIETNIGRDVHDRKKMAVVTTGGKEAKTGFRVLERFINATLVECRLYTGRTHQIRVHMAYIGHPVIGDPKYCNSKNKFDISGQALHSHRLLLKHPRTGEEMEFTAPVPEDMEKLIKYFRLKSN